MWTDSSTSFGGGEYLLDESGIEVGEVRCAGLERRQRHRKKWGVSINVLEFFSAVFCSGVGAASERKGGKVMV
jgi:hypothetical protein